MEGGKDGRCRQACFLCLGGVDVDFILREGWVEGGVGHLDFGLLVELCQEALNHREELVDVAAGLILHLKLETVGCGVTGNHRRGEGNHTSVLHNLAGYAVDHSQHGIDAFGFLVAFAPVF